MNNDVIITGISGAQTPRFSSCGFLPEFYAEAYGHAYGYAYGIVQPVGGKGVVWVE